MRRPNPLELAVWAAVAIPTVGFSIGCILPGCGDGPDAPSEVLVDEHPPAVEEATGDTGDLAIVPEACDAEPAGVELFRLDADTRVPLGDEVSLEYAGGCSEQTGLWLEIVATGLVPGAVDVGYTVAVDGQPPVERTTTWDLSCGPAGPSAGAISIDLPVEADQAAVTIDVLLVDELGVEVSTSATFVATVTED